MSPVGGRLLRRGIYLSLAGQWSSAIVSVVASVLVARMMQPAELGVFTVTMALANVLATVQAVGAQEYLLYTPEITIATRRSALGLSLATGVLLALLLVAAGPLAARFYGNAGMQAVLLVLAVNTLVAIMASPVASMLGREQRFDLIALFATVTNIVTSAMQVLLTWLGFSYLGLAWAMVVGTGLSALLHLLCVRRHVLFRPSFHGAGPLLRFGVKLLGVNLTNQINTNSPQILIGALSGLGNAALYGRANTITQIYAQTVSRAVDPVINGRLAAEGRSGQSSAESLRKSSAALLVISLPFFGFMGLYAHILVPLVFGPQWIAAVPAMRALCCGFFVWPLLSPASAALLAAGRAGLLFRIGVVNMVARAALVVLLSPLGLAWIAIGVSLSIYGNLLQSLVALRTAAGVSIRNYARGIAGSIASSALVILVSGLALLLLQGRTAVPWMVVAIGGAATGIAWLAVLRATRHLLWEELMRGHSALVEALRARRMAQSL